MLWIFIYCIWNIQSNIAIKQMHHQLHLTETICYFSMESLLLWREGEDNIKLQLQNATDIPYHKVMAPTVCSLISIACPIIVQSTRINSSKSFIKDLSWAVAFCAVSPWNWEQIWHIRNSIFNTNVTIIDVIPREKTENVPPFAWWLHCCDPVGR